MKFIYSILFLLVTTNFFGQIQVQNDPASGNIIAENPFFDASSYDLSMDASSAGKGLVFPRTDLTTWSFNIANLYSGSPYFTTAFDGMIVYNSGTGNTPIDDGSGNNPTLATAVTPGFYYFSNPYDLSGGTLVTTGQWLPLGSGGNGGGGTKDITTTEAPTSIKINGNQVYAINGTFTASGTTTTVTVAKPTGMTGYYKFSTYFNGTLFRSEIHSFDVNVVTNNVVLGNGFFTEIYPAGTYSYVLEYFKQ